MTKMETLVRNILTLGYLSLEAKEQLRHLLQTTSCNLAREDYQSQQWMICS